MNVTASSPTCELANFHVVSSVLALWRVASLQFWSRGNFLGTCVNNWTIRGSCCWLGWGKETWAHLGGFSKCCCARLSWRKETRKIQCSGPAPSADVLQHGRGAENGHSFQLCGVCAPASLVGIKKQNRQGKEPPNKCPRPSLLRLLVQSWRWLPYKGLLPAAVVVTQTFIWMFFM